MKSTASYRALAPRARPPGAASVAAFGVALVIAAPLVAVLLSLASPFGETIAHITATTGPAYLQGTIGLVLAVGAGASFIGVATALAVALADFPGRRFFSMALAAPLALPAYIAAYAYGDFFGPFGGVAAATGAIVDIRSFGGAVFVLTMTLYPYVYLAARAAFIGRFGAYLETARLAGASPARAAIRVLAPAARPAIAGAAALVMMETAADFGVADYFGVQTLSVGVFRTWNAFGDLTAAAQLASLLVLLAIILVTLEAASRRGEAHEGARVTRRAVRLKAKGLARIGLVVLCAAPIVMGAVIPVLVLVAKLNAGAGQRGLGEALQNSVLAASAGAAVVIAAAGLLAYGARAAKGIIVPAILRIATIGYAVPGAVIAIGVLAVGAFAAGAVGGPATLATGLGALLYAYAARFMTVGVTLIAGGLAGIAPAADEAARLLGASGAKLALVIHAPLVAPSLVAAAIIVFVDIVKELPATLILRSFNFETLATRVYRLAGDERLAEAAPAALALIGLGVLPAIALGALGAARGRNG